MSTQGNIAIWNYTKLISRFPEVETEAAFREIIGGFVYENPFKSGEKLLISYDGDNLHFPNGFYPDYAPNEWVQNFSNTNLTADDEEKVERILEYLLTECCEAEWQVWN